MRETERSVSFRGTTPEQRRLAQQLRHGMESYYYTKEVVEANGDDGITFEDKDQGTELSIDANMMRGVMKSVHARYKDLRGTGTRGKELARSTILFVQESHKTT